MKIDLQFSNYTLVLKIGHRNWLLTLITQVIVKATDTPIGAVTINVVAEFIWTSAVVTAVLKTSKSILSKSTHWRQLCNIAMNFIFVLKIFFCVISHTHISSPKSPPEPYTRINSYTQSQFSLFNFSKEGPLVFYVE